MVDMLRAQPSGGESRHSQHQQTVPAIPLKRPVTAPAAVAPEILNRRERRKNKGALPNSGAGEGIIPTVAIKAAPVTAPLSKSAILQQMAEMKRYTIYICFLYCNRFLNWV